MLDEIVSAILGACTILSFVGLIDGVIEYRRSPYLAWLRQETKRRIEELENEED